MEKTKIMQVQISKNSKTAWFRTSGLAAVMTLTSVFLTPAFGETLKAALEAAYTSNPSLLAERARLRATDEGVAQARAGWLPTITLQGSYGHQDILSKSPGISEFGDLNQKTNIKSDPLQGQAMVSLPVFRGGQTVFSTRQAKALVRAGRAGLHGVESQILLDAVTAFSDVIRDNAVVDLSKNNVQVLQRQLQASQDRFRVGEITRTDVAQSEARLSRARSNLIASEAALTASKSAYERVIGHSPVENLSLPNLPALPSTEGEAATWALSGNPQMTASREVESASRNAVTAAKGALLPQFEVRGIFSHAEDNQITGNQQDVTQVQGVVTIPLYQGGATYSRIRQAKQTNNQNRIQIAETERALHEAVANAWEGLRSARSTIESSQEQVRANEIAFDGVSQEAQVGSRTTLDVLDAEQELLDSRVTLVRSQRNEYVASYALLSVIGQLTANDLNLNVDIYDPKRNSKRVRRQVVGFWTYNE